MSETTETLPRTKFGGVPSGVPVFLHWAPFHWEMLPVSRSASKTIAASSSEPHAPLATHVGYLRDSRDGSRRLTTTAAFTPIPYRRRRYANAEGRPWQRCPSRLGAAVLPGSRRGNLGRHAPSTAFSGGSAARCASVPQERARKRVKITASGLCEAQRLYKHARARATVMSRGTSDSRSQSPSTLQTAQSARVLEQWNR
jgi:hypothetical protein